VAPAMLNPDYWVGRIPRPDQTICAPDECRSLENEWRRRGLLQDLSRFPGAVAGPILRAWMTEDFRYIRTAARFGENGRRLTASDIRSMKRNVNLTAVSKGQPIRWGMSIRRTSMKLLPTRRIVTAAALDLEFNMLNHSEIRLAEPLAVLHESRDRKWLYVAAEIGRGWVEAADVAFTTRQAIRDYREQPNRVVLAAEVRFRDGSGRLLFETAKMGARLAIADRENGLLAMPRKDRSGKLYFTEVAAEPAEGMSDTPRPFTPRSVIEQSFQLLNAPYGWGGGFGYGDCSEFIRRVGLACGISLPRSTSTLAQALPSQPLKGLPEEKQEALSRLPAGVSLLKLPGHIMLLLGSDQGRVYVIHNLYGIHEQDHRGTYIRRVARVVVSELSLGAGGRRGSLLQRVDRALFLSPSTRSLPLQARD